jgi:YD repeat-containing protein
MDTTIVPGTRYWYRVRAFGSDQVPETQWSAKKSTLARPGQVTVQEVIGTPTSAQVNWHFPDEQGGIYTSGYRIFMQTDDDPQLVQLFDETQIDRYTFSKQIDGLSRDHQYTFMVQAVWDDVDHSTSDSILVPLTWSLPNDLEITPAFVYSPAVSSDKQSITLTFQSPLTTDPTNANIVIEYLDGQDTNSVISLGTPSWANNVLTFQVPNTINNGVLPDGNYQLRILSPLSGTDGKTLSRPFTYDFFFLGGDVNHDRTVDGMDLYIVSANRNQSGRRFDQGDLNYDGAVNSADVTIVSMKWQARLPSPSPFYVWTFSSNQINLSWDDTVIGEAGWRVEWSDDGHSFDLNHRVDLPENQTYWENTNLADGQRRWYRIRAFGNGVDTAYTAKKAATTVLPAPVLTLQSVTSTTAALTWVPESTHHTNFIIERAEGDEQFDWSQAVGDVRSYTVTGLMPGINYSFRIRASNDVAVSAPSSSIPVLTLPLMSGASLNGTLLPISADRLFVSFNFSVDVGTFPANAAEIILQQSTDAGYNYTDVGSYPVGATPSLHIKESISYKFRAYLRYGGQVSAYSNEMSYTAAPLPPSNVTASWRSSNSFDIRWKDNTLSETGFLVYYSTSSPSGPFTSLPAPADQGYYNFWTYSPPTADTTYYIKVGAVTPAGTVESEVKTFTLLAVPVAPSAPTASVSGNNIYVQWTAVPSAAEYVVERYDTYSSPSGILFVKLATVTTPSYTDHDVRQGVQYQYRIKARNITGTSSASTPATVNTPLPMPTNFHVDFITAYRMGFKWDMPEKCGRYFSQVYFTDLTTGKVTGDGAGLDNTPQFHIDTPPNGNYSVRLRLNSFGSSQEIYSSPIAVTISNPTASPPVEVNVFDPWWGAFHGSEPKEYWVDRTGPTSSPLTVRLAYEGNVKCGVEFAVDGLTEETDGYSIVIPQGQSRATFHLRSIMSANWFDYLHQVQWYVLPSGDYAIAPFGSSAARLYPDFPQARLGDSQFTYGQPSTEQSNLVVVHATDHDGDSIPDMGDGFDGSGSTPADDVITGSVADSFAPLYIDLAYNRGASIGVLRFSYSQSDPAAGNLRGIKGYEPAAGLFRLWGANATVPRHKESIKTATGYAQPYFIPSVDTSGQLIQYSGSDFQRFSYYGDYMRLYLEAVRATPSGQPQFLRIDYAPIREGDTLPLPDSAFQSISIPITAVMPAATPPVGPSPDGRYGIHTADFQSNGYGRTWGVTRAQSSSVESQIASTVGNGWTMDELPRLLWCNGVYEAILGKETLYFDKSSSVAWAWFGKRYRMFQSVQMTDGSVRHLIVSDDGDVYKFYDFGSNLPKPQRGALDEYDLAGGIPWKALYDAEGYPSRFDQGTNVYTFSWGEHGGENKYMDRIDIRNSRGPVRSIEYQYYTEADGAVTGNEFMGNEGDLKTVKIRDASGLLVDYDHYRYTKKANPGDTSQLAYVVDRRGAARAGTTDADDVVALLSNSSIADFAVQSVAYYPGTGKVNKVITKGTGAASSTSLGSDGTVEFTYSDNTADALGINTWTTETTELLADGTSQVQYTNFAGEVMLTSTTMPDGDHRAYDSYDAKGRVVLHAGEAAIEDVATTMLDLVTLKKFDGLIYRTEYDATTGLITGSYVQHGSDLTSPWIKTARYYPTSSWGTSDPNLGVSYLDIPILYIGQTRLYPDASQPNRSINSSAGISAGLYRQPTTTISTAPYTTSQNGGGSQTTSTYDLYGQLRTRSQGFGTTTYQYNDETGLVTSTSLAVTGKPTVTNYVRAWDELGRPTSIEDALGRITTYAYDDSLTDSTVTTTSPSGAVTVVHEDLMDGYIEYSGTTPDGTVRLLSKDMLDNGGRAIQKDRYTDSVVYHTYYRFDAGGRRNYEKDAAGTVRETVYDGLGRRECDLIGGQVVRSYEYDGGGPGDGNLTKLTDHPDNVASHDRATKYVYDWRDQLTATLDGTHVELWELDNLGRTTKISTYEPTATVSVVAGIVQAPSQSLRRSWRDIKVDDRGQTYEIIEHGIDQSTGNDTDGQGNSLGTLTTDIFHDGRDMVVKMVAPGGVVTTHQYDGVGRETYLSHQTTGAVVLDSIDTTYDAVGNVIFVKTGRRMPNGGMRYDGVGNWYDSEDRLTDTVTYGTNASTRPTTPPPVESLPTAPLAHNQYDAAGNLQTTIDPNGNRTCFDYDRLHRLEHRTDAYLPGSTRVDNNRLTNFEYNGLDQLVSMNVVNRLPGNIPQNQTTTYAYGTANGESGSTVNSFDLLGKITYPGGSTESFAYDAFGEVIKKRERNGVLHYYDLDSAGRIVLDSVTFPADTTPLDTAVNAHRYRFDSFGRLVCAASEGGGVVLNSVARAYNPFGQLAAEWQKHTSGALLDGTGVPIGPATITFTYTKGSNFSRLTQVAYPSGYQVGYQYSNSVDDAVSRVSSVVAGPDTVETYEYMGLDRILNRNRPATGQPDLTTTIDSLGFVQQVTWAQSGSIADSFTYTYDYVGNVLGRANGTDNTLFPGTRTSKDELYTYNHQDVQNRFYRGNVGSAYDVAWSLDSMGNRYGGGYGSAYNSSNQQIKDHFGAGGEAEVINTPSFGNAAAMRISTYDAWGHPILIQGRKDSVLPTTGTRDSTYQYDALGRRIRIGSTFTGTTSDDVPANVTRDIYYMNDDPTEEASGAGTLLRYVYSPDGQMIFRDRDPSLFGRNPFTGGSPPASSGLTERIYSLTDAAGNTTALVAGAGALLDDGDGQADPGQVIERFLYDEDGKPTALREDYSTWKNPPFPVSPVVNRNLSHYYWEFLYGGQRFSTFLDTLDTNNFAGMYEGKGGEFYDPENGRRVQPSLAAHVAGKNAYDPNASGSFWTYLPGELWNTVSGIVTQTAYMARDVINDYVYTESTLLTGGRWSLGYNNAWSSVGQMLDNGQTTWLAATGAALPLVGSGYNAITGTSLLTGEQLNGWEQTAAGFGLLADVTGIAAGGMKWAGVDSDLGALAQQARVYAGGAWEGLAIPRTSFRMASLFGAAEDALEDLARANRYGKMRIQQALEDGGLSETTLRRAGVTGTVRRSAAARSQFLKSLADDYRTPSWMKPWLVEGRVPPGYAVDHVKPLSVGGADTSANMRLQARELHDIHHRFYRPWE